MKNFDVHKIIVMINKDDEDSEAVVMLDDSSYSITGRKALALYEVVEDLIDVVNKGDIEYEE